MDDKDKKIEELEQKLKDAESSKNYWIAEATKRSEQIEKLKDLLRQAIDKL